MPKTQLTACYFAALLALGLTTGAVGPSLPHLAKNTHSQLSEISLLLTFLALGYLLGSLAGGRLIDRIHGNPVVVIGLVAMSISFIAIPFSPELLLVSILSFILGLSQSFVDIGANLMIVWLYGSGVGPYMNGLHLSFGVGTLIAPLILAISLEKSGSISWGFLCLAILSLPAALFLPRLPNPSNNSIPTRQETSQKTGVSLILILIVLFYFLYLGFEGSFNAWIYTYAFKMGLATEITAAYLTSAFWAAFTFGRFLGIPASTRIDPKTQALAGLTLGVLSLVMIIAFPFSAAVLWAGTIAFGLGVSTLFPTLLTIASQAMPLNGKITSLFFASASVGGMFFPWLTGQFVDAYGPRAMMPLFLVTTILTIGIITAIRRPPEPPGTETTINRGIL